MLKTTFILIFLMLSTFAQAGEHNKIDTLGVSGKGQFVALEEYGYKSQTHSYYVTIKILNVWTKEYVGSTVEVEESAARPHFLKLAREKAKKLAADDLKKFNIISG